MNSTTNTLKIRGEKYLWQVPVSDQQQVYTLAGSTRMAVPLVQTLVNRGLQTQDELERFLFTSRERDVASGALLKDAEKVIDRLLFAIERGQKILIAGDYDVDGITSTALMLLCLAPLGAHVNFFLPNRIVDGYGLSVKTVQRAHQNGYQVIITVDNGISAFDAALEAQKLGIDLIITDHHRPHAQVPPAFAIVNPAQDDCTYPFKKFAGVGVSFKLMELLYTRLGKELPPKVYELLMLGTVADVVPLLGENRFWVRHGLQQVRLQESLSIQVLKSNARIDKPALSSTDIGFFIAPQINALGRLDDPRAGVKFLIGTDDQEIMRVGKLLGELNQTRKSVEQVVLKEVERAVLSKSIDLTKNKVLIAAQAGWAPGVIGLVASRLVGQFGRPTILLHITKDGIAKGSCRSIPELNIFEALSSVSDMLTSFGGHPMAAGLSLPVSKIPLLQERLDAYVAARLADEDLVQKLYLDAELRLPDANQKLIDDMGYLEPFGCENAQPKFYIQQASLVETPLLLKDEHVKGMIFAEGVVKPVIFFNRPDLYPKLIAQRSEPFSLAVSVTENYWNGRRSVEFQGHDVAGLKGLEF